MRLCFANQLLLDLARLTPGNYTPLPTLFFPFLLFLFFNPSTHMSLHISTTTPNIPRILLSPTFFLYQQPFQASSFTNRTTTPPPSLFPPFSYPYENIRPKLPTLIPLNYFPILYCIYTQLPPIYILNDFLSLTCCMKELPTSIISITSTLPFLHFLSPRSCTAIPPQPPEITSLIFFCFNISICGSSNINAFANLCANSGFSIIIFPPPSLLLHGARLHLLQLHQR